EQDVYLAPAEWDLNGVANRQIWLYRLRERASRLWFGDNRRVPTREQLEEAQEHCHHELEEYDADGHQHMPAGDYLGHHELDDHPADGHQFDGRHPVEGEELRQH